MSIPIQPLTTHIVGVRLEPETVSRGGIAIPDVAQAKPDRMVVLAVGPGETLPSGQLVPTGIRENDVVLIQGNRGTEIEVNGVVLTFIKAANVLAVESAA